MRTRAALDNAAAALSERETLTGDDLAAIEGVGAVSESASRYGRTGPAGSPTA